MYIYKVRLVVLLLLALAISVDVPLFASFSIIGFAVCRTQRNKQKQGEGELPPPAQVSEFIGTSLPYNLYSFTWGDWWRQMILYSRR